MMLIELITSPSILGSRPDRLWGLPSLLLLPAALWRAAAGGGHPPPLRHPVGPPLHPLLLQHGRPLHLLTPGGPQAHPVADGTLCPLPVRGAHPRATQDLLCLVPANTTFPDLLLIGFYGEVWRIWAPLVLHTCLGPDLGCRCPNQPYL